VAGAGFAGENPSFLHAVAVLPLNVRTEIVATAAIRPQTAGFCAAGRP
jgi:hypothetical protein